MKGSKIDLWQIINLFKNPISLGSLVIFIYLLYWSISETTTLCLFPGMVQSNLSLVKIVVELTSWSGILYLTRQFFFNIRKEEAVRFFSLMTVAVGVIFIYTLCRQMKDSLLLDAAGAEGTTAAKIIVLVAAVLYQVFFYAPLARRVAPSQILLVATIPTVVYFICFYFFLLDHNEGPSLFHHLNPQFLPSPVTIATLTSKFPTLRALIDLLQYWPLTVFFILSEIWAVAVIATCFWQIANQYVTAEERPRWYPAFLIIMQFAALLAGFFGGRAKEWAKISQVGFIGKSILLVVIVFIITILANAVFFANIELKPQEIKNKKDATDSHEQTGIWSTIKSKPLYLLVAMLTVYYGLSSVFMEQFWKSKVNLLAKMNNVHNSYYLSSFIRFSARVSIVFTMIITNAMIQYSSWFALASLTPLLVIFGSICIFGAFIPQISSLLPMEPTLLCVQAGTVIVGLFKCLKYGSFDMSKEQYIAQQGDDKKREIKNIEAIFNRVGKSGGAMVITALFTGFGLTYQSSTMVWILYFCCLVMGGFWLLSVLLLSRDYKQNSSK